MRGGAAAVAEGQTGIWMSGFELATKRVEQGCRLRFYQDFYGRQWVKARGDWRTLWMARRIYLSNQEIVALKRYIAQLRKSPPAGGPVGKSIAA